MSWTKEHVKFDWVAILLYFLLVAFGWVNIYSASLSDVETSVWNLDQVYVKQLIWIGLSLFLIVFILAIEAKFYERFSSIIYLISLLSLAGLYVFGKEISGATSWYVFGGVSLQPSEFAKAATALALAKHIGDLQTHMETFKSQLLAFIIIALPALLIIPQPDPGSALIYAAFVFPMYREGMHYIYLLLGFIAAALFVLTLLIGVPWVIAIIVFLSVLLFVKNKNNKPNIVKYIFFAICGIAFSLSVNYIFNSVFEQRHRDRFNIVLGREVDTSGIGYNTNQSEIAIGSGGWFGKGWTQGTQTKGNFVPEQHTDYIFSTVGEEWGFIGSLIVLGVFIALIVKLLVMAERQKSQFNRVYGYSVAAILFMHVFVNIGMVIGLLPTVGIPLPFFSYGGSGLWGFTVLLFIFIRLDASNSYY